MKGLPEIAAEFARIEQCGFAMMTPAKWAYYRPELDARADVDYLAIRFRIHPSVMLFTTVKVESVGMIFETGHTIGSTIRTMLESVDPMIVGAQTSAAWRTRFGLADVVPAG